MLCCICGHRDATNVQRFGTDENQLIFPMCDQCFGFYIDKVINKVEISLFNEQKGEQDEE